MEALAGVGKQSCLALVGVLCPTARPRNKWFGGELDLSICEKVHQLLGIYQYNHDGLGGPDLREGVGHKLEYSDFSFESAGVVAVHVYDHCEKAGFRPVVTCLKRSTGKTWLKIELNW